MLTYCFIHAKARLVVVSTAATSCSGVFRFLTMHRSNTEKTKLYIKITNYNFFLINQRKINADLVIQTVTIYVSTLIRDFVVIVTQDSSYIK